MAYPIHTKEYSKCTDCYRCLRKCELKAIRFNDGRARIMANKCVLCGECVAECPQETKVVTGDFHAVEKALAAQEPLVLSIGEMVVNYYPKQSPESIRSKALAVGFEYAEPVDVMEPEMKRRIAEYLEKKDDLVISSHCAVIVNIIEMHYPQLVDHLLPVPTLPAVHARDLKVRYPNAKVVHVTACIAELNNRRSREEVDFMITFPELQRLFFNELDMDVELDEFEGDQYKGGYAFSLSGQMAREMRQAGAEEEGTTESFSGMKTCLDILDHLGDPDAVPVGFLELMTCDSGCVSGYPLRFKGSIMDRSLRLIRYEKDRTKFPEIELATDLMMTAEDFKARPYRQVRVRCEDVNTEFERFFGEDGIEMLDCAACGYDTCYEKSEAVIRGEAERKMCMSYLRRYAESYASSIVESSVNGLIVFNEDLEILEVNPMAQQIFGVYQMDVGHNLEQFFDPSLFHSVVREGKVLRAHHIHLEEAGLHVQLYAMPLSVSNTYLIIVVDVTGMMLQQQEMDNIKKELFEKAEKVIDHQMKSAQEIAHLLGETTAETKITLLELMNMNKK